MNSYLSFFKNIKFLLKRYFPFLGDLKKGLRFLLEKQIFSYEVEVSKGEIEIFKKLYPHINVLFDVGVRQDTHYCEISQGNNIEYHLFEINPRYFKLLEKKNFKIL